MWGGWSSKGRGGEGVAGWSEEMGSQFFVFLSRKEKADVTKNQFRGKLQYQTHEKEVLCKKITCRTKHIKKKFYAKKTTSFFTEMDDTNVPL